ncbi:MAG: hypothetical protein HY046_05215, partial [Acidobacteria bacterium]|nr:hypothetical protein [Acidobacteriota bacterium]
LCIALLLSCLASSAFAQQRPLRTPDAEILPPGTVRTQIGFDFLQDVTFPLSGLSGDLTSVGVLNTRVAVGKLIEIQTEQAIYSFLAIKQQAGGLVVPAFTGPSSTRDFGDLSLFTKVKILSEKDRRPGVAFRFGFQMPNSNQARGIGLNTSNLFADVIFQKHIGRANLYGSLGIAILESPTASFTQNDVLTYGAAVIYQINDRLNLAGEVAGRYSSRAISPALVGTESRSQARLGFQIFAGGLQWDVAGVAGLTSRDAKAGFTFGISKDLRLFDYEKIK